MSIHTTRWTRAGLLRQAELHEHEVRYAQLDLMDAIRCSKWLEAANANLRIAGNTTSALCYRMRACGLAVS